LCVGDLKQACQKMWEGMELCVVRYPEWPLDSVVL